VIVLDYTLPRLSGREVPRELERIQPDVQVILEAFSGREAPVMLTGMTLSEALQQFDGVVKDEMGAFAVCCGIPAVMDSDFRRPKIYLHHLRAHRHEGKAGSVDRDRVGNERNQTFGRHRVTQVPQTLSRRASARPILRISSPYSRPEK
jgi:hypothetical protein